MKYITYHINTLGGKVPVAVEIKPNQDLVGEEIFFDADSLHGLSNVRVNNSGRIRKDAIIIDELEHYKYDWDKLTKKYNDKCFNPNNFPNKN